MVGDFRIDGYHSFLHMLGADLPVVREWSLKQEEAQLLVEWCGRHGPRRVVEIGVFCGLSTAILLDALPDDAEYYAIDPFFDRYAPHELYRKVFDEVLGRYKRPQQRVHVLRGYASVPGPEAVELARGHRSAGDRSTWRRLLHVPPDVDLCFLDGDHHGETALSDFLLVWPRIRPGGAVAVHDVTNDLWAAELAVIAEAARADPTAAWTEHPGLDGVAFAEKVADFAPSRGAPPCRLSHQLADHEVERVDNVVEGPELPSLAPGAK